jgi:hypothetical protein
MSQTKPAATDKQTGLWQDHTIFKTENKFKNLK